MTILENLIARLDKEHRDSTDSLVLSNAETDALHKALASATSPWRAVWDDKDPTYLHTRAHNAEWLLVLDEYRGDLQLYRASGTAANWELRPERGDNCIHTARTHPECPECHCPPPSVPLRVVPLCAAATRHCAEKSDPCAVCASPPVQR